jgi:hypothetical protein
MIKMNTKGCTHFLFLSSWGIPVAVSTSVILCSLLLMYHQSVVQPAVLPSGGTAELSHDRTRTSPVACLWLRTAEHSWRCNVTGWSDGSCHQISRAESIIPAGGLKLQCTWGRSQHGCVITGQQGESGNGGLYIHISSSSPITSTFILSSSVTRISNRMGHLMTKPSVADEESVIVLLEQS